MAYQNAQDPRSAAAKRKHYEANKEQWAARRVAVREQCRDIVRKAKEVPCADCGQSYPPVVMDFDHLGDKVANVSRLVTAGSVKNLVAEIAKCEVVCSNCHRIRTWNRGQFGPYADTVPRLASTQE